MSLGMTLDQLVDPEKYRPFPELWESQSPPGERLQEYVEREWNKQPHEGETPPQIVAEVLEFSEEGSRRDRRRRAARSRRTARVRAASQRRPLHPRDVPELRRQGQRRDARPALQAQ